MAEVNLNISSFSPSILFIFLIFHFLNPLCTSFLTFNHRQNHVKSFLYI